MYIQLRIEAQHYRKTSIVVCQWICIYNWGLKHNIRGKYLLWFVNEYVYTTEDWSTTLVGKYLFWFVNEYVYTTEDWSTTLEENIYCDLSMNMYIQLRIEAQHYRKTSIVVCQWICIYNWGLKHNIIGKHLLWFEDWSTTL